ncbi:MAG: glycosyltransferase family 4 protein [Proteobacteria bacterium]|nr:glycosyltransferase family 4 protein [Pseudomonadota bacterium]
MVVPKEQVVALQEGKFTQAFENLPAENSRRKKDSARILYVVSAFPCLSETFIVREVHALLEQGADIRIVALRRGSDALVQEEAGALLDRVIYPPGFMRSLVRAGTRVLAQPRSTLAQPLTILRRLWRAPYVMAKSLVAWFRTLAVLDDIEAWSPDHVHAHWATYPSTAAMQISRSTGRPFSFTAHAHDIFLDDQLMPEKLSRAAFVATISRFNREFLRRRYREASRARIEIVHCGVPRRDPRVKPATFAQPLTILSVGRLDEVKGFPTLLEACRTLVEQGVRFRCDIVGEGPLRAQLEAQLAALQLQDHVFLQGARRSGDVEKMIQAADVFVLASQPSRQGNMDGIPVAIMEAMACGTPVVSTVVSGIPELVENESTGLLVPSRDPVSLAHAIRRLHGDPELRRRCIDGAARKIRREFDAESEGEKIHRIIHSVRGEVHAEALADSH